MLEIKDLSVQYGKQAPTIEHFNLSMKKGEIISVVGESGSGKTTVLNAVASYLNAVFESNGIEYEKKYLKMDKVNLSFLSYTRLSNSLISLSVPPCVFL